MQVAPVVMLGRNLKVPKLRHGRRREFVFSKVRQL